MIAAATDGRVTGKNLVLAMRNSAYAGLSMTEHMAVEGSLGGYSAESREAGDSG
jgi:hypothetical protein